LEDLLGLEDSTESTTPEAAIPTTEEEVHSRNEVTKDDEAAFLRDALGAEHAAEALGKKSEKADQKPITDWEDKPINPHNKPMHPSVTEEFFTKGGKEVKAVHDKIGTFWHIEFVPGGQVPAELKGKFTDENSAKQAIKRYLATKD
jgi:hypothetical protein